MTTHAEWAEWRERTVGVLRLAQVMMGDETADARVELRQAIAEVIALAPPADMTPIPIRLECPACGELHIDEGEFATKPHHTHACQSCGAVWRPAVVCTVGVRFLPGFKNA